MVTVEQLKKVSTYEQLEALKIGNIDADITCKGGHLGLNAEDIAKHFKVNKYALPQNFGVYCNYAGGGVRGTVNLSLYHEQIKGKDAELLTELSKACKRVYISCENEIGLNDEGDGDNINWEAKATNVFRGTDI